MCLHKYIKIYEDICVTEKISIFFNKEWTEDVLVKIYKCLRCKILKGYYWDRYSKHKISKVELFKFKNLMKD